MRIAVSITSSPTLFPIQKFHPYLSHCDINFRLCHFVLTLKIQNFKLILTRTDVRTKAELKRKGEMQCGKAVVLEPGD